MMLGSVACISLWTGSRTNTKLQYASVPPLDFGVLWWQWMSLVLQKDFPVIAHLPHWAEKSDIRLSANSVLFPWSGLRISSHMSRRLIPSESWISFRPSGVYGLTIRRFAMGFLCWTYPIGYIGSPLPAKYRMDADLPYNRYSISVSFLPWRTSREPLWRCKRFVKMVITERFRPSQSVATIVAIL